MSLKALFKSTGAQIQSYSGLAELRVFADTYPNECVLDTEQSTVHFGTETESFEIRSDLNHELETVFCGTITGYTPRTVLFDSGYKSSVNEVMDALIAGATLIYGNRNRANGDTETDDEDEADEAKPTLPTVAKPSLSKKHKGKHKLDSKNPADKVKNIMKRMRGYVTAAFADLDDMPAAVEVLSYYAKRQRTFDKHFPKDVRRAIIKAIEHDDNVKLRKAAIETVATYFADKDEE